MRKIVTLSMVAAAALAVTACGTAETTNTTDANAMVTEMNAADAMEGTTNDTMTNVDGAMGADNAVDAIAMDANATDANGTATNAM